MMEAMIGGDGTSPMAGMRPMGGGMGMSFIGLLWLAQLIAIGGVLGWLIVRGRHPWTGAGARETLDSRYARGEIDRDDYLRMRSDLADGSPAG